MSLNVIKNGKLIKVAGSGGESIVTGTSEKIKEDIQNGKIQNGQLVAITDDIKENEDIASYTWKKYVSYMFNLDNENDTGNEDAIDFENVELPNEIMLVVGNSESNRTHMKQIIDIPSDMERHFVQPIMTPLGIITEYVETWFTYNDTNKKYYLYYNIRRTSNSGTNPNVYIYILTR